MPRAMPCFIQLSQPTTIATKRRLRFVPLQPKLYIANTNGSMLEQRKCAQYFALLFNKEYRQPEEKLLPNCVKNFTLLFSRNRLVAPPLFGGI